MPEAQNLHEFAKLCRREAANSMTHEAIRALGEMAAYFDDRARKTEVALALSRSSSEGEEWTTRPELRIFDTSSLRGGPARGCGEPPIRM